MAEVPEKIVGGGIEALLLVVLAFTGGHLFGNGILYLENEELIPGQEYSMLLFLICFALWRFVIYARAEYQKRAQERTLGEDPNCIRIPIQTPLQILLMVLMIPGGSLALMNMILMYLGTGLISGWLVTDAIAIFIVSFLTWCFTKCEYIVNPASKIVRYYYINPFYSEKRIIPFKEIAALSIGGELKGWPFISNYRMEFTSYLVFTNGRTLPIFKGSPKSTDTFENFGEIEGITIELSQIMGRPYFPGFLAWETRFSDWISEISRVPASVRDEQALQKTLWELGISAASMELLEPHQIKVDLPTWIEKFVLILVTLLFGVSTIYLLQAEWAFIETNPRIIYLLLLDSSSIVITVLGLWRWLIDEYFVLDTDLRKLRFRSRILFFNQDMDVANFEDIGPAFTDREEAGKEKFIAKIEHKMTGEIFMSDFVREESVAAFRAYALSKITDKRSPLKPALKFAGVGKEKTEGKRPSNEAIAAPGAMGTLSRPEARESIAIHGRQVIEDNPPSKIPLGHIGVEKIPVEKLPEQ